MTPKPPRDTPSTRAPKVADPRPLAEAMRAQRRTMPLRVLSGCLLISFLCGAAAVGGVIAMLAIAHSLGWR